MLLQYPFIPELNFLISGCPEFYDGSEKASQPWAQRYKNLRTATSAANPMVNRKTP